jgi:NitT/TauT family transport system substrate-binding protein
MWNLKLITLTLALALLGGSAGHAQSGASTQSVIPSNGIKLSIPYNAVAFNVTPLWVAIDAGLFRRYGIDATTEFASQSPVLVASMLSGETSFAVIGADAVISADLNGADLVILASGPEKLFFTIYASSGIRTVDDLKAKKIGVTQFGTTTDFITRYVLDRAGLRPDRDATILPMGTQAIMLAALVAERIDAATLGSATILKADLRSFNAVADMTDYDLAFYTSSLVGKKSWLAAHRDDARNVVRGYLAGIAALFTNKPAATAAIAKYVQLADAAAVESAYQLLAKTVPRVPVPKPEALKINLAQSKLPGAAAVNAARFIDASFVNELKHDGFIDGLYH